MSENRFMLARENIDLARRFYAAGSAEDDAARAQFAGPRWCGTLRARTRPLCPSIVGLSLVS
jgi:hypothetical protein